MLGKPIPKAMRAEMAAMPYYHTCARYDALHDHVCQPNPMTGQLIEWEHAFIYGSSKINEIWAIVPICYWAHSGPGLVKHINEWLAINRATPADLQKYPRKAWDFIKKQRNARYGVPELSTEKAPF